MAATVRPITLGRYSDSVDAKDDEVTLLDNKKIYLGTGNDLQIYHDASDSYIVETGTGRLNIRTNGDAIKLQTYKPSTITLKSNRKDFKIPKKSPWFKYKNLWNLYKNAHTPWEWHEEIFKEAKKNELSFFFKSI